MYLKFIYIILKTQHSLVKYLFYKDIRDVMIYPRKKYG